MTKAAGTATTAAPPRGLAGRLPFHLSGTGWRLVGVVVLPLLLATAWAAHAWRIEHDRARETALRQAEMVREFVLGVVRLQQAALDHVETLVRAAEAAGQPLGGPALHQALAALDARLPAIEGVGVVDAAGQLVATSRSFPVRVDVTDREYLRVLRGPAPPPLHLERAVLRPSGSDALVLARRREAPVFAGILAASIPMTAVTEFLGRIAADPQASASLLRADGLLLLRQSPASPPTQLSAAQPAMHAIMAGDSGTYTARAITDGITRIYGFARIGDLPLYAHFGVPRAAVVEAWARSSLLAAAALALAGLLAALAVTRTARSARAELDRRRAETAQARVADQEAALRELHHRVKNSLMTVQSLIRLRRGAPPDPEADAVLERRVLAMAQVHELLHVARLSSRLDLGAFLGKLCAHADVVPPGRGLVVTLDAEPVEVAVEQAGPLALVAVELVGNAVRHAFPDGRAGRLELVLRRHGAHAAELLVRDDGVGLPEGGAQRRRRSGLVLAERLATQLRGTLEARPGPEGRGTEMRLTFPHD